MSNVHSTSGSASTGRREERRGRRLLVASEGRRAEIRDARLSDAERVETVFDALGALGASTTSGRVELIAIDAGTVESEGKRAAARDALERVDPSVEVIVVGVSRASVAPSASPDAAVVDAAVVETFTSSAADEPSAASSAPGAPRTIRAIPPRAQLGDTDLVDAVLREDGESARTALALIAQHTGWTDVVLRSVDASVAEAASAVVEHDGVTYGVLASDAGDTPTLRRWAAWLGPWLALDARHRELRTMSYQDALTGAWNRRFFDEFMDEAIRAANEERRQITLLVFDIDNFKQFNDSYGHEAGDEILREVVRLLESVIRQSDRVCRIGGDEFVVVFSDPSGPRERGSMHPATVEALARRFQDQVCRMAFPKLGQDAPGALSISGGLATYPWDGRTPAELLRQADRLALGSKRCGKNAIMLGPEASVDDAN